jgi:hypothetical protein
MEAWEEVSRLEARQRSAMREIEETKTALREARVKRDEAMSKLRRVQPVSLPPIPNFKQMLAMAKRQCPDRDEAELKTLVGRMHSSTNGANFCEWADDSAPVVTGTEVRDVADSHYDIRAPEPAPSARQQRQGHDEYARG